MHRKSPARIASVLAIAAAVLVCASNVSTARASGTIVIHHQGKTADTYEDVDIRVLSGELFLTSDDGDGTFVVNEAACSYQGQIIVCYPKSVALVQDGEAHLIDLASGTIYLNYTDADQKMSWSSSKLPSHGVLLSFTTKAGTFVTLRGRIDQVVRQ